MRVSRYVWWSILIAGVFAAAQSVSAQKPPSQPSPPPTQGMPAASPTNNNANTAPVETVQPLSKQENKAIKSFRDVQPNEADKKTQLGENFIQTYPDSRYRPEVVSWLASAYMRKGEVDKLQSEGDKELAIAQKNPLSLAALGSNLARAVNANTPDLAKHLEQAETFCKKSLEILATTQKPEGVSEEKFTEAKNETSALAYSGLGTVAFRRGKYADAVTNLRQAVKLSPKDPVDFYVLGKSEEAQTNYSEALAAYTKCAAMPGGMQAPCQSSAQEMKPTAPFFPNS